MNRRIKFFGEAAFVLTIILALALVVLPVVSFNLDNVDNEVAVLRQMGITVDNSMAIPQGRTVNFYAAPDENHPASFVDFLNFINEYNVTAVDFVQKSLHLPFYDGPALYFVVKGVVYLYQ